mmetsp:Transcript_41841/g.82104  ORF Transcript_41841/g.82104 Transcript_41841/m.82104 type:complete len:286 (+) Transcript_41841:734-1591(+)
MVQVVVAEGEGQTCHRVEISQLRCDPVVEIEVAGSQAPSSGYHGVDRGEGGVQQGGDGRSRQLQVGGFGHHVDIVGDVHGLQQGLVEHAGRHCLCLQLSEVEGLAEVFLRGVHQGTRVAKSSSNRQVDPEQEPEYDHHQPAEVGRVLAERDGTAAEAEHSYPADNSHHSEERNHGRPSVGVSHVYIRGVQVNLGLCCGKHRDSLVDGGLDRRQRAAAVVAHHQGKFRQEDVGSGQGGDVGTVVASGCHQGRLQRGDIVGQGGTGGVTRNHAVAPHMAGAVTHRQA